MAENTVATEGVSTLGRLSAAQTAKLVKFAQEQQQSALEALSTTLDKKLAITAEAATVMAAADVAAQFQGNFIVVDAALHPEGGAAIPALIFIGEDESSALFNVPADGADDYSAKLQETVQTALTDLSDFLTLSVSVNS